ncbi:P-loop NTPase [Spirosoma endbachense]|uniref:Novel STAND NTPase 5 domain-containing protein n=1 Tax=Spirosoma endbachense TaxID=2666025 RepID=A0A6P1VXC2_9BACT|nr:hypothetical protein [Spirosoma endbachense]QHV97763.1 hypothetical protein GJR95_23360 [Spirosoma endbachense]
MPIVETALAFVGVYYADAIIGFTQDRLKGAAQKRLDKLQSVLSQRSIPINHDIQKAVRQSHLEAGLQAARWGRSQWKFEPGDQEGAYWEADAAYRLIIDYLDAELYRFKDDSYIPNSIAVSEVIHLNFSQSATEIHRNAAESIRQHVLDELLRELEAHLRSRKYARVLPKDFRRAVLEGWADNGKNLTVFDVMCDYFHEYVKTNERLRTIIQLEWLADVKTDVNQLTNLVHELNDDFIETYGKIPAYFEEIQKTILTEIKTLKNEQPISTAQEGIWQQLTSADFRPIEIDYVKKYYEGHDPVWPLIKKFTFKRDRQDHIIDHLEGESACIITSAGGEGKSTLLHQLGIYYFEKNVQVFYNFHPVGDVDTAIAEKAIRQDTVLIIDHAEQVLNLPALLIKAAYNRRLKVILASRKNE